MAEPKERSTNSRMPHSPLPFLIHRVSMGLGSSNEAECSDPSRRNANKELSITPHVLDSEPIPVPRSRGPATQTWFFPGWGWLVKQGLAQRSLRVFRLWPLPPPNAEEKSPPSRCLRFPQGTYACHLFFHEKPYEAVLVVKTEGSESQCCWLVTVRLEQVASPSYA